MHLAPHRNIRFASERLRNLPPARAKYYSYKKYLRIAEPKEIARIRCRFFVVLYRAVTHFAEIIFGHSDAFTRAEVWSLQPNHTKADHKNMTTAPQLASLFLDCSWAYSLTKLMEEARVTALRVAAFQTL